VTAGHRLVGASKSPASSSGPTSPAASSCAERVEPLQYGAYGALDQEAHRMIAGRAEPRAPTGRDRRRPPQCGRRTPPLADPLPLTRAATATSSGTTQLPRRRE
jgi:hypothetical protein